MLAQRSRRITEKKSKVKIVQASAPQERKKKIAYKLLPRRRRKKNFSWNHDSTGPPQVAPRKLNQNYQSPVNRAAGDRKLTNPIRTEKVVLGILELEIVTESDDGGRGGNGSQEGVFDFWEKHPK